MTPRPTEFPTFAPPAEGSAMQAAMEALGVCLMFFALGSLLAIGNMKLDSDRRARKKRKVRSLAKDSNETHCGVKSSA